MPDNEHKQTTRDDAKSKPTRAQKNEKVLRDRSSLEGLSELQTEILFVLWKHAHEKLDWREVGLTANQIQSQVNASKKTKGVISFQRVYDALALLEQRGEQGEGRVGWRTVFVPLREEHDGEKPGGRPRKIFRLVSKGMISWGDTALLLEELALWRKKHSTFDGAVLAQPLYEHLLSKWRFPDQSTIDARVAYCVLHSYLFPDPETPPHKYLKLGHRAYCEQAFIHRVAGVYREYLKTAKP
jgi:hypothetical protein